MGAAASEISIQRTINAAKVISEAPAGLHWPRLPSTARPRSQRATYSCFSHSCEPGDDALVRIVPEHSLKITRSIAMQRRRSPTAQM